MTKKRLTINDLSANPKNPRKANENKLQFLDKALKEFGDLGGVVFNRTSGLLVGGHQRKKVIPGNTEIIIEEVYDPPTAVGTVAEGFFYIESERFRYREVAWDQAKEFAANVAANKGAGMWDYPLLAEILLDLDHLNFDMDLTMFDADELGAVMEGPKGDASSGSTGAAYEDGKAGGLSDKFGVPPFTVLDGRAGYWQARKKAWMEKGIDSSEGRGQLATTVVATEWMKRGPDEGGSIFDPVVCELAYRWFSPAGGIVLDPFAGGSVRGIVAALLGRQYVGIDLREEQVRANRAQAMEICTGQCVPAWECGDSVNLDKLVGRDLLVDFVFSCPPYHDLEKYSEDPADLSNMEWEAFEAAYYKIIAAAVGRLRSDRFACFVVGDIRDKRGVYRNFVSHTIAAFEAAGAELYNEAVLVTPVGSLPLRTGKQFSNSRKMGKTHQNVLVFVKGDPKLATLACGSVEVEGLEAFLGLGDEKPDSKYGEEM